MNIHTARQIKGNPEGKTAINVAKASGRSLERIVKEAEATVRNFRLRQKKNKRLNQ